MHKPTYHRHKLRLVALLAVMTALISGGCTHTDEPGGGNQYVQGEGVVAFGAYVNNSSATRAQESNIHTLKQSGFGVFAAISGTQDFQDNPPSGGFAPNYMYNQKVAWQTTASGDSAWVYEPELLWPGMQKVSFFAYSPYADKANETITGWPGINDVGSPTITFALNNDIDKQVDLLYANALNLVNTPLVTMNFKHALSRISIQLSSDSENDPNTTISINRLTFKSADLGTHGVLNLATGRWSNISGTTERQLSNADTDAMKKGFMVIPPASPATMEIIGDYTLTTDDPKLPNKSFKADCVGISSFTTTLEAGKVYCLKLKLKPNAIEITANIHDWDGDEHTWESNQDHDNKLE